MEFKIETAKWEWAEAVKTKEVYRDEEFIRTRTPEDSLDAIDHLLGKNANPSNNYTITVLRDGEYITYWRHSMPCLGGLVKYRDSHGEKYFMNPYFPRDIKVAYPEGDTVYIACKRPMCLASLQDPYIDFLFSQESPWVSAFGKKESVIFKNNYLVLTDMNTDPTVFYSLMRLSGFGGQRNKSLRHPKAEILMTKNSHADPRRLAGQKPIRISGGTWAEGFGYTRSFNESIFKTKLPTKFKDFGQFTGGYPEAPFTNEYYLSTMRSVFGVNAAANDIPDDIFLRAWDYFREESKKLSDSAD